MLEQGVRPRGYVISRDLSSAGHSGARRAARRSGGKRISQGSYSTTFYYDADHARIKQVESSGKTTLYINPRIDAGIHYEEESQVGSATVRKHYLYAGSTAIGVYISKSDGSSPVTRYFHTDHLGSITAITNEAGALVERMCYDPWGKRRNCDGSDDIGNTLQGQTDHHGYTGREHLDDLA